MFPAATSRRYFKFYTYKAKCSNSFSVSGLLCFVSRWRSKVFLVEASGIDTYTRFANRLENKRY